MAKRKFNVKFFILFSSITITTFLLLGGFYYYQIVLAPERNFNKGNDFMASGNFDKAATSYGRSVSKKPNNLIYLDALKNALLKVVPKSASDASEHYNKLISVLTARTRAASTDSKVWIDVMEAMRDRAELYNSDMAWREFSTSAQQMENALPPNDSARSLAKFWKVLGLNGRYTSLPPDEREILDKDLAESVKLLPNDERAWIAYLDYLLLKADMLERGNQRVLSKETLRQFDAAVVECKRLNPQGVAAPLAIAQRLIQMKLENEVQVSKADLDAAFKTILDVSPRILADRKLTLSAASVLFMGKSFETTNQAMELLQDHLKAFPNDAVTQRIYLNIARSISSGIGRDIANEVFTQANLPTSIESVSQQGAREAAADLLYTLAFEDWRRATEEKDKKEKLAIVLEMRDRVVKFFSSQALLLMVEDIEARTALAEGKSSESAIRFEALLKKIPDPAQEMYFYAGYANILRNQPGTALGLVSRGLERYPNFPPLLNLSARLNGGMGRYDEARKALQKMLELNPDDKDAKATLAIIGDGKKSDIEVAAGLESNAMSTAVSKAERLMMKQDYDGAITLLAKEFAENPKAIRVLEALCQINIVKNDIPAAQVFIEKGLALEPKNGYFLQMKAITSNKDPIDRILASVSAMYPDPKEQAIPMYQGLSSAMFKMRQAMAQLEAEQIDALMKDQFQRCEKLLGPALDAALAADPKNLAVLEIAATDASDRKDYAAFEKYVALIAGTGDLGLAATIQSRNLVLQDKLPEALAVLQDARKKGDENPIMLRQLGMLYERTGNIELALELIRESYDRRPNDVTTGRTFAELLQRSGERQKALQILQQLSRSNPEDTDLLLSWLELEGQIGDRSGAFALRKRLYKERPSLAKNSIELARMLLETPSDPNLMLDNKGAQKFTQQDLLNSSSPKIQQALATAAKANLDSGFEIVKFLQEAAPADTSLSLMHARALKKYGKVKDGEDAIRKDIAKLPADKSLELWIGLGVYLDEADQPEQARIAFDEARKQQNSENPVADVRISDYWFSIGQWQNARDVLEPVSKLKKRMLPTEWMRLSEICSRLRDYDAAEQYLAKASVEGTPKETLVTVELLRATNFQGRAELAIIKGEIAKSEADLAQAHSALNRATVMMPNSAQAWVSLSDFERRMYQRTHDPKYIVAADEAANRATDISMGYWPGIQNKQRVLLEQEKLLEAIVLVDKFLSIAPQNSEARQNLIGLYIRSNNIQRAVELAQQGANMNPRDSVWQTTIGSLNLQRKDFDKATEAFDAAFVIQPEINQMLDSVNQRIRGDKKDWQAVVKMIRANMKLVTGSPKAQTLLSVALVNSGQREAGLASLGTNYKLIRDGITAGSLNPDEWGMWYAGLGQCFDKKPEESEVFVTALVGKAGLDFWDCNGLSALYAAVGDSGTAKSIEWMERGVNVAKASTALDAKNLQAMGLLQIGNMYYKQKDFVKATLLFEQAVALVPDNPGALNNAAYLIANSGANLPRAVELARKCVELNPNVDDFQDTLGFALLKDGKPADALEPLQKAIVMTQKPGSMIHLAQAFIELKRFADAKGYLEKAKTKSPTEDQIAEIKALELKLN